MSANPWEDAYLRFESPDEEVRKFLGRLRRLGAETWPREARIVELFSGRGSGLRALEAMGFRNVEGVDLSPRLVQEYRGEAKCHVGDCRALPFADESKDVLIVQGGLHHLLKLPDDLDRVFGEARRVLSKSGRMVIVEPWLTPFLRVVHRVCKIPVVRRVSPKMDALATMIEHEIETYEQWLQNPKMIRDLAHKHFNPQSESFWAGKWTFVGEPR